MYKTTTNIQGYSYSDGIARKIDSAVTKALSRKDAVQPQTKVRGGTTNGDSKVKLY